MSSKELTYSDEQITALAEQFQTPFHLIDEAGVRASACRLNEVYDWVSGPNGERYINYFAVKATPLANILDIVASEGMGADASSGTELGIAAAVGLEAPYVMFTSNHTRLEEYREAYERGAIINLDDYGQIDRVLKALDGEYPDVGCARYDPGKKKVGGVNAIIGMPGETKFGMTDEPLEKTYRRLGELGVKHYGLHIMVVSNELDAIQHVNTARLAFEKIAELSQKLGIAFEFVNLGGGLGIPYKPDEQPVDYQILREGIIQAYNDIILNQGLPPLRVVTENGRHVTGPNGILVMRAISIKEGYHRDIGVDATVKADNPRPADYDAYHHMTVIGKRYGRPVLQRVVDSMCEDNGYFFGAVTKERLLPKIEEGDLLVQYDTGAHTGASGNNYNGKTRAGTVLLRADGTAKMIQFPETRQDLYSRQEYPALRSRL